MAGLARKSFFLFNFGSNFDLFEKLFTVRLSTNLAQFSNTFLFSKNKMAVLVGKSFFLTLASILIWSNKHLRHDGVQI